MTGMYAMHYAVSGCPIAAKNKVSGAQTKVCTYTSWCMYYIQQFHYDTCVDIQTYVPYNLCTTTCMYIKLLGVQKFSVSTNSQNLILLMC